MSTILEVPEQATLGVLEGGDVLPGFRLAIQEWFDRARGGGQTGGGAGS